MVSLSGRPLTGSSPRYPGSAMSGSISAGGTLRMLGRRRMTKFRFRMMVLIYLTLGCIIPYYVMKNAEESESSRQQHRLEQRQEELFLFEQEKQHRQQEEQQLLLLHRMNPALSSTPSSQTDGGLGLPAAGVGSGAVSEDNPKGYRRRAFFEDIVNVEVLTTDSSQGPDTLQIDSHQLLDSDNVNTVNEGTVPLLSGSILQEPEPSSSHPTAAHIQQQQQSQRAVLDTFRKRLYWYRTQSKIEKIKTVQDYEKMIEGAIKAAEDWVQSKMPEDVQFLGDQARIPGTGLTTAQKTKRFRALMDQALNAGRWVYESDRDYPDFGGATGWNKKKQNERDRDVAIDRPPFPEAGKYHWKPLTVSDTLGSGFSSQQQQLSGGGEGGEGGDPSHTRHPGWHADRIPPEDFCSVLGPRHIVLVGDLIHWQLHDSIMYNMFDNPQACYGDLACHIGVGHPLCPLPNDVRLKFVRNDALSAVRLKKSKRNETKTQDPVEMPWLKDVKLKDTIILGAGHQTQNDQQFRKRLSDAMTKIRIARPEALIIYRNNPVGHPDCPSKANGFNSHKVEQRRKALEQQQQQQQQQQHGAADSQKVFQFDSKPLSGSTGAPLAHNNSTFAAGPKPFDHDIPIAELLDYPLNWVHYDRQNQMAKVIIEAGGGIYWNVATMTNMRPDGHVGGQDCLSYKRPGPTDEWAVSLYNLLKTIQKVEQET
ncbi:hypothetical protein BGZ83_011961 [Gryganskiella cystojenkinii]|nr:hypothetical protein BGZ83_011961 [Gryganskiella cystojenkinii]